MSTLTPLQHAMRLMTPEEQEDMAARAGTSRNYLYQLATEHRGVSAKLAARLERAYTEVKAASPRRDILPELLCVDLAEVCAECDYARQCLGDRATVSSFRAAGDDEEAPR